MLTKSLKIAIRFTLITALLLGIVYPLLVTGFAQLALKRQANGELITRNGAIIGSQLIGQNFSCGEILPQPPLRGWQRLRRKQLQRFKPVRSRAKKLVTRIQGDIAKASTDNPTQLVPIDLVTASGSGLDPFFSGDAALCQVHRIAQVRKLTDDEVTKLVNAHITPRQFGLSASRESMCSTRSGAGQPE